MPIENVIFDMDGVLVDTEPVYVEVNNALFRGLGIEVPLSRQLEFVGVAPTRMWGELKAEHGLSQTVEELIDNEKEAQFETMAALPGPRRVPGVTDFLDALRRGGAPCAVASSSSRKLIRLILEKSALSGYFRCTVSGEDVEHGKPSPDIFLLASEKLGVDPGSCLVVEDSPHGVKGAREAGMVTCGLRNPNSGQQDLSEADILIDGFEVETVAMLCGRIHIAPASDAGRGEGEVS